MSSDLGAGAAKYLDLNGKYLREFRILEDMGHYLQEEEPEAVVEWIMEFLQGPMSAPLNDF